MPVIEEPLRIVLDRVTPLGMERVALLSALGRVLGEDVAAPWDMPRYDHSAMDGFALRSADCAAEGTSLRISGCASAGGGIAASVPPGGAIRIMTGARVPGDCDAVVPREATEEAGGSVTVMASVHPRQHIRFQGEDVAIGDTVLSAGAVLQPPEIGMLASLGKSEVRVHRRARVAVLCTGNELVELGEPLSPGRIFNSNALYLAAAIREAGAEPIVLGIARDDKDSLRAKIVEGLTADALVTSGGTSTGEWDLVLDVLSELGGRQIFQKGDIKQGGPKAFGMKGETPVFSLPGRPVSTMIVFEEFVRPALLKMMGHRRVIRPCFKATLRQGLCKNPDKVQYLRVRIELENGRYVAVAAADQSTAMLRTMIWANAVAVLPEGLAVVAGGDEVDVYPIRGDMAMLEEY